MSLSCRNRPSGHNQTRPGRTRPTRRKARPAQAASSWRCSVRPSVNFTGRPHPPLGRRAGNKCTLAPQASADRDHHDGCPGDNGGAEGTRTPDPLTARKARRPSSTATSNNGHGPHLIGLHRPHHMAAVRTTTRTTRDCPTHLRRRRRFAITHRRSGQQLEASRMLWPDRVEVTTVASEYGRKGAMGSTLRRSTADFWQFR